MAIRKAVKAWVAAKKLVEDFLEADNDYGLDPKHPLDGEYELTEADREDLESRIERALIKAIRAEIQA